MTALPAFIRPWTAPFHVTMDGIKDDKGCWICSAANNKLAHEMVELMNFAAAVGQVLIKTQESLSEVLENRVHLELHDDDRAMLEKTLESIRKLK